MNVQIPTAIAWLFFVPGIVLILVDLLALKITGVFLLGVVFLILWAYLYGVFTKAFWGLAPVKEQS
jgi:hypothetical protein